MEQSTIRAFQRHMSNFQPVGPFRFDEQFAVHRFLKKYERPIDSRVDDLSQQCWERFLTCDQSLPKTLQMPDPVWYRARVLIHSWLKDFKLGEVDISNGSAYTPTLGYNSIAQKLRSAQWDYTPGALDQIVDAIVSCRALRRSLEMRFRMLCRRRGHDSRKANAWLWHRHSSERRPLHSIIRSKVVFVCERQEGSRFSTVPKNNEKRRPINLECLLNMICQRRVGNGLRDLLKTNLGLDLDTLAAEHRKRVSTQVATIDLQDASDSVSMALVRFLFPRWFVDLIEQCRSPMVLGPDGDYYLLEKVSSMGNGFTFELMTVILTAACRTLDAQSSVFGDDIIIARNHSDQLVRALENVGFVVNRAKSFVDGPFRESCGANYHDDYGYIESYDLMWPESIGDCVGLYNKVARLAMRYPSFGPLHKRLLRAVPHAWRGPSEKKRVVGSDPVDLPTHFATGGRRPPLMMWDRAFDRVHRYYRDCYQLEITPSDLFFSWKFVPNIVGRVNRDLWLPHHWHRYFMYLSSGMATKDVIVGSGGWTHYVSYGDAQSNSSWKAIIAAIADDTEWAS